MNRATTTLTAGAVLAALAGGVAFATFATPGGAEPSAAPPVTAATGTVDKGDLTQSVRAKGTLGFAGRRTVGAALGGVLTWLPRAGSAIGRDERLYEVDGKPVRLMYGAKPMYRTLSQGAKGADVRQLEANLKALGYGSGMTVDDEYTWATAQAVRDWQEDHDLPETGTTGPEQIAFAPRALRVQKLESATGDRVAPGARLLTATGAERVVTFKVDVTEAAHLKTGDRVTVELPTGKRAKGRVAGIGRTAEADDQGADKTPKVDITVTFDRRAGVKGVDQAPVSVLIRGETRKDVLSVPVTALLAVPGGGYAVRVVGAGSPRDVKVELGLFADGRVEVTGDGLGQGTKVEVPGT
ncbi:peptidoglycan-binding protein [Nonomuraea sp. NPDC059007]|uniref:peptidoglycan-binding protein n=1 Tax=Nonomuraea sp. NPDC059007 TaxID=3346692 RepID=UPI0036C3CEA6